MGFNHEPTIIAKDGYFYNLEPFEYVDYGVHIYIPEMQKSDGPTLNGFTRTFFTMHEYRLGILASFVHDYMCDHKYWYSRRVSSLILRDIWMAKGLNPVKAQFMFLFTDLFQFLLHGKQWKS